MEGLVFERSGQKKKLKSDLGKKDKKGSDQRKSARDLEKMLSAKSKS